MNDMKSDDSSSGIDVLRLVKDHGRQAFLVAAGVAFLVGAAAVYHLLWGQPVRRASVLELRPTSNLAAEGTHPNGLPISFSGMVAAPILALVYDGNLLSK